MRVVAIDYGRAFGSGEHALIFVPYLEQKFRNVMIDLEIVGNEICRIVDFIQRAERTLFHGVPLPLLLGICVLRSSVRMCMTLIGSCLSRLTPGTKPACTARTSPIPLTGPTSNINGHDAR